MKKELDETLTWIDPIQNLEGRHEEADTKMIPPLTFIYGL